VRLDDLDHLRVLSDEPVPLQVDGDLVGDHTDVTFVSVPDALRVAL
jgi:diacylglycerol kinase family enzyme